MVKVSVIIPTRNRATMVRRAIESVLAQQNEHIELEVIVIDDGSTDNTWALLQEMLVVSLRGTGQGVSTARNLGLQAATGEFIGFLDDDDCWAQGYPHQQIALLQQHPEYGAVISQIMMADENLQPNDGPYPKYEIPSGWMFDAFLYYVPGVASAIVRRSVVREVGDFDPELRGSEDWDWMLRIAKAYQIGFVPAVSMIVRQHNQGRTFAKEGEDIMLWRRFRDTMSVFRRHTERLSFVQRLKLQRRFWKLRGWYIPFFMQITESYMAQKKPLKAVRSALRAVQISPVHTALYCYRSWKHRYSSSLGIPVVAALFCSAI